MALMREFSQPEALTNDGKCGLTLFEDTNGNQLLLVIDYSEHDQTKLDVTAEKTVMLSGCHAHSAESVDGRTIRCLRNEHGELDGIAVSLRPHESVLIRLF